MLKYLLGTPLLRAWRSVAARLDAKRWTAEDERRGVLLAAFVRPGGLCFDVGANMGNRVKCLVKAGVRVVAVEPQEECLAVLRDVWGRDSHVTILDVALGAVAGEGVLHVGDSDTVSSMSEEWIRSVSASQRFGRNRWRTTRKVQIETLDALVERFGVPDFVKIDVEGFEDSVVAGLHRPLKAISMEFTPEHLAPITQAIHHLAGLGAIEFNISLRESARLEWTEWVGVKGILQALECVPDDRTTFGDVYARFLTVK